MWEPAQNVLVERFLGEESLGASIYRIALAFHVCMGVCMYVCVYVCMYVCIHVMYGMYVCMECV